MRGLIIGMFLLMFVAPGAAPARADEMTLERLLALHKAGRAAIERIACRAELTTFFEQDGKVMPDSCSGEFFYDVGALRARVQDRSWNVTYVWRDGVAWSLSHASQPAAALKALSPRSTARCDPFDRGLVHLRMFGAKEHYPLEEYVARAKPVGAPRKTKSEGGQELWSIRLRFSKDGGELDVEIELDPTVNYLVRRRSLTVLKTSRKQMEVVTAFAEVAPGVYFPEEAEIHSSHDGPMKRIGLTKITEIRVPAPYPPSHFGLSLPHGCQVTDMVARKTYKSDENWQPIGEVRPTEELSPEEKRHQAIPPIKPTPATAHEPIPIYRWIALGSVGTLVLAALGALGRFLLGLRR
ncbi:MAG TPA: hypothetical protein PKD86_10370 [Gemmatales bacterium]|nr:hypothetical protein [Gemmatales bacterium]HMP59749.1 hypothetical protein [Gemmatales bacterium]